MIDFLIKFEKNVENHMTLSLECGSQNTVRFSPITKIYVGQNLSPSRIRTINLKLNNLYKNLYEGCHKSSMYWSLISFMNDVEPRHFPGITKYINVIIQHIHSQPRIT